MAERHAGLARDIVVPSLLAPSSGALIEPPTVTERWKKVAGAVFYHLQVSESSTFQNTLVNDSTLLDTLRQVGTLKSGTTYYTRVRAEGTSSWGNFSAAVQFTTSTPAPVAPSVLSPTPNAEVDSPSSTARWRKVTSATTYHLQLTEDSIFQRTLVNDSTLTDTTYVLRYVERGYYYYWRVRPKNPIGWGDWSSLWGFSRQVSLPGAVTLVAPPDRALLPADTVRLAWTAAAPAVRRYWLELAADSLFAAADVDSTVTDSVCTRTSLKKGTSYVWRVRAGNTAGWGPYSAVRRFDVPLTGIASGPTSLPSAFRLHQNYPNPFNPVTTIRFELPRRLHVNLGVFTLLGEQVTDLVNGDIDPGTHDVRFNGGSLPSGVYLCRIHAGPYLEARKLLLVR